MATPKQELKGPNAGPALGAWADTVPWAQTRVGSSLVRRLSRIAARPHAILLAFVLIAVALNFWETRGQTFYSDEWGRLFFPNSDNDSFDFAPAMAQRPPGHPPRPAVQGAVRRLRSRFLHALPDRRGVARGDVRAALLCARAHPCRGVALPGRHPRAPLPRLRMGGDGHPVRERDPASGRLRARRPPVPAALFAARRPPGLPAADRCRRFAQRRPGIRGRRHCAAGDPERAPFPGPGSGSSRSRASCT